jgi:hypothetical protein
MEHFTPISAASGGVLIGCAAAMLWLGLGLDLFGDWDPSPALASLGFGNSSTILFVAAMLAGTGGFSVVQSFEARGLRQA